MRLTKDKGKSDLVLTTRYSLGFLVDQEYGLAFFFFAWGISTVSTRSRRYNRERKDNSLRNTKRRDEPRGFHKGLSYRTQYALPNEYPKRKTKKSPSQLSIHHQKEKKGPHTHTHFKKKHERAIHSFVVVAVKS